MLKNDLLKSELPSLQPSRQFIQKNQNLTFSFGSRDTHLILWSSFDVLICMLCLSSYWAERIFANRITCYTLWRWQIYLCIYIFLWWCWRLCRCLTTLITRDLDGIILWLSQMWKQQRFLNFAWNQHRKHETEITEITFFFFFLTKGKVHIIGLFGQPSLVFPKAI